MESGADGTREGVPGVAGWGRSHLRSGLASKLSYVYVCRMNADDAMG